MKLRWPGRRDSAQPSDVAPGDAGEMTEQLIRAGGKGRPTPRRSEAQGRRPGPPPPPPTTRKEAYKRMREQQATRRAEGRTQAGDDSYLPARDRGPVRKLVRDVVDSRRNIGGLFLGVAAVSLLGTFAPSLAVKSYASSMLFAFFLLLIVDSVVLGRKIRRTVRARFPDGDHKMKGLVWYGISRSTMVRRWRMPKADVPIGAQP